MGATQLPTLWFATRLGLPVWAAVAVFVGFNGAIVLRIRWLPKPDPPPVWFERYVIGAFFVYAVVGLYFAPGLIVLWAVSAPDWVGAAALFVCVLLSLRANGIPYRPVAVRRISIPIRGLPEALEGLTLAQMTDTHAGPFVGERTLRRWVAMVNREQVDYVCLTGDLIASGAGFVTLLGTTLSGLQAKRGILAVMGNHDYFEPRKGAAMIEMLETIGAKVLINDHIVVDGGLAIAGIGDTWRKEKDLKADIPRTVNAVADGLPIVLLAHDPETFEGAAEHGVDLQLSGHLHGGQLAIPFLGRRGSPLAWLTPFVQGIYRIGDSVMYLSAGLGTTGAPIRIGMMAELPIITLIRAQDRPDTDR